MLLTRREREIFELLLAIAPKLPRTMIIVLGDTDVVKLFSANLLASIARGGLQFMLIIWLQGIWLPLHGYNFIDTPLWAGIFMLPLTAGTKYRAR